MQSRLVIFELDAQQPAPRIEDWAAQGIAVAAVVHGPQAPALPGALFVHADAEGGGRWLALARALAAHAQVLDGVGRLWLPAAGTVAEPAVMARCFDVAAQLGLELCQPAFAPGVDGAHPLARRHEGFQLRFTSTVDATAPLFEIGLFARVLPLLALGLDPVAAAARQARLGRVAIVDACTLAAAEPALRRDEPAALTFAALLDDGDGLCMGEGAEADAFVEALLRAVAALPLGSADLLRYVAGHLDTRLLPVPAAALAPLLENEHSELGMGFNRRTRGADRSGFAVLPAAAAAPPVEPVPPRPVPEPAADSQLQADLDDLRERHAALIAERELQATLLDAVAAELQAAQQRLRAAAGAAP